MEKEIASGIMLTLLLTSMLVLAFSIQSVKASGTIYIRADGTIDPPTAPIQRDGNVYTFTDNIYDSIVVERNNIVIDGAGHKVQGTGAYPSKGIDLTGRSNVTIKNMEIKTFFYGISLSTSSNNIISGNNITSMDPIFSACIILHESSNNIISENNITNNDMGIELCSSSNNIISENNITNSYMGIALYSSSNTTISGNNIANSDTGIILYSLSNSNISRNIITNCRVFGIRLYYSDYNTVSGNNVTNSDMGIVLDASSSNKFRGNVMSNNKYNFGVKTFFYAFVPLNIALPYYAHDVDASNTVDGKPIYYWINERDRCVPPNAGYVALVNCTSIRVENLSLTRNLQGVLLVSTTNSTVTKNNIINNQEEGIGLIKSSNNTVSQNSITKNLYYGIFLQFSSNNSIYHNNFIDNTRQVDSYESVNVWDDGYPSGGNYWSDYNGTDANGDGIGDTPYTIDENNIDRYPLLRPSPFWMQWLFLSIVAGITVLAGAVYFLKKRKKPTPTAPTLPPQTTDSIGVTDE